MAVFSGLDTLVDDDMKQLRGARVGLLANQAAVSGRLAHAADILHQSSACTLERLFAPEHGFRGEHQDMATVGHVVDRATGLPVISLYGSSEDSLAPTAEQLSGLDILLVDLPDIGSRYYTFAQSLGYAMKVAGRCGVKVVVVDRPNPIGGSLFEGCGLEADCRSFCGYAPVLQRHGLTLGELARLMQRGFGEGSQRIQPIPVELEILPLRGWKRDMYFDQTGLPWVLPSPNMPTLDTALVYPGACLFETTTLSEGRGTTRPFEFLGAPNVRSEDWIAAAGEQGIPLEGCVLRPLAFLPQFQKHAGNICNGIQLHVQERRAFRPFRAALCLLFAFRQSHPDIFCWRKEAYEFISSVPAVDLLFGSSRLREAVDAGLTAQYLLPELEKCEAAYAEQRKDYLLYTE
jgi:uncharacterized protein YbbC (DUF1343 family)